MPKAKAVDENAVAAHQAGHEKLGSIAKHLDTLKHRNEILVDDNEELKAALAASEKARAEENGKWREKYERETTELRAKLVSTEATLKKVQSILA